MVQIYIIQSAAQLTNLANNLTIDVSGDIFGCGADATTTGPDGADGGDALGITGGGNNIKVNLQSSGEFMQVVVLENMELKVLLDRVELVLIIFLDK